VAHNDPVRPLVLLLRREAGFRRLVGANQVSQVGEWMLHVGLAYFVYDLTGSTLASGGTLLAGFLPSILVSSVAGVLVDRWDHRRTMAAAQLLMAAGLLPLLAVDRPAEVWVVYVVTAWQGVLDRFWIPAEQALVPHLVPDADLVTANAVNAQVQQVGRLVGSGLGGVVVATGGLTALALADAATFLVSALLVLGIRAAGSAPVVRALRAPLLREWLDGLRVAVSERSLLVVFVFTLLAMAGEGVMGTLFAPFVRDVLHGSGRVYGLVSAAQAVGGIAGGLLAASLGRRLSAAALFGCGAVVFGLVDLVMFLYPLGYVAVWPAVLCMLVVGLPGACLMVGYTTLLQRGAGEGFRGRVFGALGVVQGVAIVVGTVCAGLLGETVGIVPVLAFQGVAYTAAGVVVLLVLRAEVRAGPGTPEAARTLAP
jgi:MFS family permease